MRIIAKATDAAVWSAAMRREGRSIGFVPTMGALHRGHLTLVARAKAECDAVCVSIFVNPLQFNNPDDLRHYPRQLEQDRGLLTGAGCDMLFVPEEASIFQEHSPRLFDLGGQDNILEGPSRPGHFQGVVNVVERLFHYIRPDAAFFGEKDRQQLAVIQHVAHTLHWPERIVPCPTERAPDGLALSSRNLRLSPQERAVAPVLYQCLQSVAGSAFREPVTSAKEHGLRLLRAAPSIRLEYLEISDPLSLEPLVDWGDRTEAVALVAAWLGPVRLIDNVTLHKR